NRAVHRLAERVPHADFSRGSVEVGPGATGAVPSAHTAGSGSGWRNRCGGGGSAPASTGGRIRAATACSRSSGTAAAESEGLLCARSCCDGRQQVDDVLTKQDWLSPFQPVRSP